MNGVSDEPTDGHALPDVADVPLVDLLSSRDGALANARRRYELEADHPTAPLSAFSSKI